MAQPGGEGGGQSPGCTGQSPDPDPVAVTSQTRGGDGDKRADPREGEGLGCCTRARARVCVCVCRGGHRGALAHASRGAGGGALVLPRLLSILW